MKKPISEATLDEQVEQLPKEMSPKRDLWQGIEKAIAVSPRLPNETYPQKTKRVHLAWAASVVAAVLLTWFSFSPQMTTSHENLDLASVMQKNFEQQKTLMLTSFGQPELTQLSPEMQQQLLELSSARAAISKALENDPNNSELLNLLRWTQKQELELLNQLYSPQWQTI
ncbi:hypothetical protein [Thalassotalea sp. SU-HH00458]|uniref:hypothetical protein n=1 Tax=Thalassotalea sp. SU-HH00458 TaxID=3127657 RepID=UPI0031090C40